MVGKLWTLVAFSEEEIFCDLVHHFGSLKSPNSRLKLVIRDKKNLARSEMTESKSTQDD